MKTTNYELQQCTMKERRMKRSAIIYNSNNIHYNIFTDYKNSLEKTLLSEGSKYNLTQCMKHLLAYLEKENIENIESTTKDNILKYLKSINYSNLITLKNEYFLLRKCLIFLYENKYINTDFSIYIPSIRTINNSTIPTVWDIDTMNKLLSNVDACTQTSKRTCLALVLAMTYGLRISDIKKMKFSDLDWDNRQIKVMQRKTKREIILPMTKSFISAFIDYVKNERPKSEYDTIIVGRHGELLAESNHFHRQMQLIFNKSNIDYKDKKIGIHSMRHSLASELLKENIPLPIISSILGHSSTSVTTMYLKIDKTRLIKCCLSLREVKFNEEF
jgi:integrase/recombinase XerD